jgi:hypothetical protein
MSGDIAVPDISIAEAVDSTMQPEAVAQWLKQLTRRDPVEAGQAMLDRLRAINGQRLRITIRQEVSEHFFAAVHWLLPVIEERLNAGVLPLQAEDRAMARVTSDLLGQLTASYQTLFSEQSRRLFGFASSGRALLPVVRSMQLFTTRLALCYRTYSSPPKGAWTDLHELYQFAARRGLAHRTLPGEMASPISVYRRALLTAFANPLQFLPGDLDLVELLITELGGLAHLGFAMDRRPHVGLFVVKPQRDLPGYAVSKRHHPVPHHHDLLLNSAPLAEALAAKITHLADGGAVGHLGFPPHVDAERARALLARLLTHWGAVSQRRFNRLRTHARVGVCVGIEAIWTFLNSPDDQPEAPTEWTVTNESPRGFALMHVSGPITPIRVGEVVGLRAREQRMCHICVVRWVLSDNPQHLELGLEEIAPNARPVQLRRTRDAAAMLPHHALLLPEEPTHNRAASLVAPLASLDSTCELSVGELQAKLKVKPTLLVEQTSSVQLLQFSSVA